MSDFDRVTVRRDLEPDEILRVWPAVFPGPGEYLVKAQIAGGLEETFDEWFMRMLEEKTRERFTSSRQAIWDVLDELLRRRGVTRPSELDWWELRRTLFDLGTASTARMVGLRVPPDVRERLLAVGFTPPEVLDFPAIAYRMGAIFEALSSTKPVPWSELLRMATSHPLGAAEAAAVEYARTQAGQHLQPIYDAAGNMWTAQRELDPLRRIAAGGLESRRSAQELTRELGNTQRAEGVFRDAGRVIRTELAEARNRGSWGAHEAGWAPDALLFRQTSSDPCKVCLRLFKLPTGMPRLYTRAEVDAGDAQGLNTGPQETWHVRIGTIHPHCVCTPWQEWNEAMESIFAPGAKAFAALASRLRVFAEAA